MRDFFELKNRYLLKSVFFFIGCLFTTLFLFIFISKYNSPVKAANVLTNPSFTGGTTGWTLSSMTYDSTNYQDSAGSVHAFAARKASVTGTTTHNSYTSINSTDIVTLSGYWMITIGGNGSATLYIEAENQSNPGSWTTIWNTTLQSTASSWTAINTDVSSNFGTGSYRIRIRAQLDGGAAAGAGIDVWFDNMNLDVVTPTVTVGTTGTQTSTVSAGRSNFYVGGALTYVRNTSSTTVSSITISETGTIADTDISGLILYYKQEATCSTSIPGDATQFNATPGTFSSGSSTVTGSMSVGTSQVCMYVEVDIGSGASVDETIEIQITNPSTDVTVSLGAVSPATAVAIGGTTTVVAQTNTLSIDIVDGTNTPVASPSVSMNSSIFNFVNQSTTGTLGTASEKIYITSDSTTNWEVSIAATTGATALWSNSGNTIYYDFNDGTANAEDGGDTDTYGGQLTIDPSVATLSPGSGCSSTGLSLGSSASFVEDSINAITLLSATSADTNCDWALTDIDLSQSIPAEQPSDAYGIDLTLTITAI